MKEWLQIKAIINKLEIKLKLWFFKKMKHMIFRMGNGIYTKITRAFKNYFTCKTLH